MAEFDYVSAQTKINEINKLIEACPDVVKPKAFELLFSAIFGVAPVQSSALKTSSAAKTAPEKESTPPTPELVKLQGNVLAFLRRHGLDRAALDALFMLDQEPMLPVYKITTNVMAQAQLQKVLMVMLENALLNNAFKAPYKEVRDTCKEDGLYDTNFNKVLKKNSNLFKGAISSDKINEEEAIELTGDGQTRLAELIKEFSGAA